ncbi:TPA: hypothetical protein ACH3X2_011957 [Trebouxia sp. C0005]
MVNNLTAGTHCKMQVLPRIWRLAPRAVCLHRQSLSRRSPVVRAHSDGAAAVQSTSTSSATKLADGPPFQYFLNALSKRNLGSLETTPPAEGPDSKRKVYIETYGCQMNVNDSEVLLSVLADNGYAETQQDTDADVIFLNTCAIREQAEQRIWSRLGTLKQLKNRNKNKPPVVGVLGCMAERLKVQLLDSDKLVDLVAGPDAYRDIPRLLDTIEGRTSTSGRKHEGAMNVQLSTEETYADILPVRPAGSMSTYLSIMRGCNNMCSFCIVPYTRGRERSRPLQSILEEVQILSQQGIKEVTLLGQNVNSYADTSALLGQPIKRGTDTDADPFAIYAQGFQSVYKPQRSGAVQFAELLDAVASVDPEMRIRFTSPHPKDFSDDVLKVIATRPNVCKQLHMPAQSGNTNMLERMRRGYTRQAYDDLVAHVRDIVPGVAVSTDVITGFCGETEEEHKDTLDLMQRTQYDQAFMFAYSEREKTHAARHLADDVPADVKSRRLQEIIAIFREGQLRQNEAEIGKIHLVLVEGFSKRSDSQLSGRTDTMKRAIFVDVPVAAEYTGNQSGELVSLKPGDYVAVKVHSCSTGTLFAEALGRTTLQAFAAAPSAAADGHDFVAAVHDVRREAAAMAC